MKYLLLICASILYPAYGDNPCENKGMTSVPGQFVNQMMNSLNLTSEQVVSITSIQEAFFPQFEERANEAQALRVQFFDMFTAAIDDGSFTEEERAALKARREIILGIVVEQKQQLTATAALIRAELTEDQLNALNGFEASIVIPEASITAVNESLEALVILLEGYVITGNINPILLTMFQNSLNNLLDTIYIPDWIEERIDFWRNTFGARNPEPYMQSTFDRIKTAQAIFFIKRIQGIDIRTLENFQGLPFYKLVLKDLVIDVALVSPLAHCYLTGD